MNTYSDNDVNTLCKNQMHSQHWLYQQMPRNYLTCHPRKSGQCPTGTLRIDKGGDGLSTVNPPEKKEKNYYMRYNPKQQRQRDWQESTCVLEMVQHTFRIQSEHQVRSSFMVLHPLKKPSGSSRLPFQREKACVRCAISMFIVGYAFWRSVMSPPPLGQRSQNAYVCMWPWMITWFLKVIIVITVIIVGKVVFGA